MVHMFPLDFEFIAKNVDSLKRYCAHGCAFIKNKREMLYTGKYREKVDGVCVLNQRREVERPRVFSFRVD